MTAQIEVINASLGQMVNQGDIIAKLYTPSLNEEIKKAEAQIDIAISEVQEAQSYLDVKGGELHRRISAGNSVSKEEVQVAEGEYKAAQSKLATATSRLSAARADRALLSIKQDQTTVKSPINGYIGANLIQAGNMVSEGDLIAEVINTDELTVRFAIPEEERQAIKIGEHVTIWSSNSLQTKAVVTAIAPAIDPITRLLIAEASFANTGSHTVGESVWVKSTASRAAATPVNTISP